MKSSEGGGQKQIVATLDLHGCRKDQAIRELTNFLEEMSKHPGNECWVKIITGSGSHSQEGPVLRSKVSELLLKRDIDFALNRGRGSFTVNAKSGFVLYKTLRAEDTKIRVMSDRNEVNMSLSQPALSSKSQQVYQLGSLMLADDHKIKEESRKLQKQHIQETRNEIRNLKQAISDSASQFDREEMIRKQEEHQISKVLELSERERKERDCKDDELLEKALLMSVKCSEEENTSSEEIILKSVLAMSREETTQKALCEEELDDQLQQAIKLSMQSN